MWERVLSAVELARGLSVPYSCEFEKVQELSSRERSVVLVFHGGYLGSGADVQQGGAQRQPARRTHGGRRWRVSRRDSSEVHIL